MEFRLSSPSGPGGRELSIERIVSKPIEAAQVIPMAASDRTSSAQRLQVSKVFPTRTEVLSSLGFL